MTTPNPTKDYYRVLQVDPAAEQEVIEAAYKRLALKYRPDVNHSPDAKQRMQEINEAYEVLSVPLTRAKYDREQTSSGRTRAGERPTPDKAERTYGRSKVSYEVSRKENGWIEVKVLHSDNTMRQLLLQHSTNPQRLLQHYNAYSRSTIKAQSYLSEVMADYRDYFEKNRVRIVLL